MSATPNFRRRKTDSLKGGEVEVTPRERRKRARKRPADLKKEIEPMLAHVEPEVSEEIRSLIQSGKLTEAKKELMEYVVEDDRSELVQEIIQKKVKPVEEKLHWSVYILSLIPVLILFYCIYSILAKGHLVWPF